MDALCKRAAAVAMQAAPPGDTRAATTPMGPWRGGGGGGNFCYHHSHRPDAVFYLAYKAKILCQSQICMDFCL